MDLATAMRAAVEVATGRKNPKRGTPTSLTYYTGFEGHDLINPVTIKATYLGKGMFTTAYLGDDNWVYLVTVTESPSRKRDEGVDFSKEMLSEIYRSDGPQPHIPIVEKVGYQNIWLPKWGKEVEGQVYRSPLYNAPLRKGNSAEAWKEYRTLEAAWRQAQSQVPWTRKRGRSDYGHLIMDGTIENFERLGGSESVAEALDTLRSGASLYGAEYTFEFSPRNLATDGKGQLILLDSTFSLAALR